MKLPPLNALRMFDAVARLGGVRAAAEELHVTPSAVSQQVKLLEDFFQAQLLHRQGRSTTLTEVGHTLYVGTAKHLRGIAAVAESIRPRHQLLTIVATTTLATRWLIPRLSRFMADHPDTQVRVEAVTHTEEHRPSAQRLVIHEGTAPLHADRAERLFTLDLIPVAAPAYLRAHFGAASTRPRARKAWPAVRLLHEPEYMWWPQWFEANGVAYAEDPRAGLHFSHLQLSLTSALHGHGVALVPAFLVAPELAKKELLLADPRPLRTPVSYYATWDAPAPSAASAMGRLLRWLIAEAAAS